MSDEIIVWLIVFAIWLLLTISLWPVITGKKRRLPKFHYPTNWWRRNRR
jgi:hypothetical protein